jgi:cation:H+ antiporter
MIFPILAILVGLVVLVFSSDMFVDGAAATARFLGMPSLLIGMVIIGFGTSAPELVVSTISAVQGNPGIAVGNAYGSNIANIALILGVTALIKPVQVSSRILKKELPILTFFTALSFVLLIDLQFSRTDALVLLLLFLALMIWSIYQGLHTGKDTFATDIEHDAKKPTNLKIALLKLVIGLLVLILSSRVLVWGAVALAKYFGVSDLIIGLTIVAIGTSLPELASSIIAARKGEHDLAMGNIIGSNLFNTTAVVGVAGSSLPFSIDTNVLHRDMLMMTLLTVSLFVIGYGFQEGRQGRVNRFEGASLVLVYGLYTAFLIRSVLV